MKRLFTLFPLCLVLLIACSQAASRDEVASAPGPAAMLLGHGLVLLHNFEYEEARDVFLQMQQRFPEESMGYWGEAMSYNQPVWFGQQLEAAQAALLKAGDSAEARRMLAANDKEQAYMDAADALFFSADDKFERDMRYMEAMRAMHQRWPGDVDITALYALAILGSSHGGRQPAIYAAAADLIRPALEREPRHPGLLHYLIHATDDPINASKSLHVAEVYAEVAEESAHALHMPTHIYFSLGKWNESNALNERALAASVNKAKRRQRPLDMHFAHNIHWLLYGYLQVGRVKEALGVLETAHQAHQQGELDNGTLLALESMFLLETGQWQRKLPDVEVPERIEISRHRYLADYARAVQALEQGNANTARQYRKRMQAELERMQRGDIGAQGHRVLMLQLDAMLATAQDRLDDAEAMLKESVGIEDGMPYDYGPAWPVRPAHEFYGDWLLERERYSDAIQQFQLSMQRFPKRRLSLIGTMNAQHHLCNQRV